MAEDKKPKSFLERRRELAAPTQNSVGLDPFVFNTPRSGASKQAAERAIRASSRSPDAGAGDTPGGAFKNALLGRRNAAKTASRLEDRSVRGGQFHKDLAGMSELAKTGDDPEKLQRLMDFHINETQGRERFLRKMIIADAHPELWEIYKKQVTEELEVAEKIAAEKTDVAKRKKMLEDSGIMLSEEDQRNVVFDALTLGATKKLRERKEKAK